MQSHPHQEQYKEQRVSSIDSLDLESLDSFHTDTYVSTVNLVHSLYKDARKKVQDHDRVNGDRFRQAEVLYGDTLDHLFREVTDTHHQQHHRRNQSHTSPYQELEQDETSSQHSSSSTSSSKEYGSDYNVANEDLEQAVRTHAQLNRINYPLAINPHVFGPEGLVGRIKNEQEHFSFEGLLPFTSPAEQLQLLKAREKQLIIIRWRNLWDEVRPPADKWYELKNKTFTQEAMRCKRMIRSPGLQQLERRTREIVLDLHRTQTKMA